MFIPNELFLKIFSYLSYLDLYSLLLVNKNFYNLSNIIIDKKDKLFIQKYIKIIKSHLLDIYYKNKLISRIFPLNIMILDNLNYFRFCKINDLRLISFMLIEYDPNSKYKQIVAYYRDPDFTYLETNMLDNLYIKLNLDKYTCLI